MHLFSIQGIAPASCGISHADVLKILFEYNNKSQAWFELNKLRGGDVLREDIATVLRTYGDGITTSEERVVAFVLNQNSSLSSTLGIYQVKKRARNIVKKVGAGDMQNALGQLDGLIQGIPSL